MTASNTFGRATVLALTNKSGGGVVAGDVVILDTTNNDAFTTTTSAATTQIVGIATGTIASNAVGLVLFSGYASLVNVNASVTRGHYGATHTVAKQAADAGATRASGTFCEFLTGGTTPDAIIYNPDLGGASLTNPMNAKGQMIVGDTGGTPTALTAGAANALLIGAGAGAFPSFQALASASYRRAPSTGNYTTNSTTFVDIDAANMNFTITTGARRVLCTFSGVLSNDTASFNTYLDIDLDGTRLGNGDGGIVRCQSTGAGTKVNGSFSYLTDALSAASHVFKFRWRVDGHNGTIVNTGTDEATIVRASVVELPA